LRLFSALAPAIEEGAALGAAGHFPTVYLVSITTYALTIERQWPPPNSRPALKWSGDDWLLVPNSMQTLEEALETRRYFADLGFDAVAVDLQGISYDVFLAREYVPRGACVLSERPEEEAVQLE